MRPVLLDLNGFASFRQPAIIRFADADYFALVGPTGSGKSTVIDAMTFALYGSVPRWKDKRAVMYGLAPTATRATVRLVFDVSGQRYVAVRELRRAKSNQVSNKNARLERLLDPTAAGTSVEEQTEVIAADSGVTSAVEKLLGLTFENFCQCVVLPQGEFAEFLRASGAERRAILLQLLGAEMYGLIRKEANIAASVAEQDAARLAGQLEQFDDATEQAAADADRRFAALEQLTWTVAVALPRIASATDVLAGHARRRDQLTVEHEQLTALVLPDGVRELDDQLAGAHRVLEAARAVEQDAQDADLAARDALAAAPSRGRLEQVVRDRDELRLGTAALPAVEVAASGSAGALTAAQAAAASGAAELDGARLARDQAQAVEQAARTDVARLAAEQTALSNVAVPSDLPELAARAAAARQALAAADADLRDAELAEQAAHTAVDQAPARAPLNTALTDAKALEDLDAELAQLEPAVTLAATAAERAAYAVQEAEQAHRAAQAEREQAGIAHQAVALREHLQVGEACPVCEQTVAALPTHGHVPELAAADAAVRTADRDLSAARSAAASSDRAAVAVSTQLTAVRRRQGALQASLSGSGTPTGRVQLEEALAQLDRLATADRAAGLAARQARTVQRAAADTLTTAERATAGLRTALVATRDPLVALGAPVVDQQDLLSAWTDLAGWATGEAAARAATIATARDTASAAAQDLAARQAAFAAAETTAAALRRAETDAAGARERAAATLEQLTARLAVLNAGLSGAPDDATAAAQLAELAALEATGRAADLALRAARAMRQQADAARSALTATVAAAQQQLGLARDTLVALGAPELGVSTTVLQGWSALLVWAAEQAALRSEALAAAHTATGQAGANLDRLQVDLTAALVAQQVPLPIGPVETGAAAAVAAERAAAVAACARVTERRAQAAALAAAHDRARAAHLVANSLGDLLRSQNFPQWLEEAALDALVVDASTSLAELSGGQFELTHRSGDFYVVDHADADSLRSVRTLSGGETFQASLALALALSSQLSSLAAGGAARLDSIFLDEGFGTLDDATLEVVAGTLENLAGGNRMVGVITHVKALADRVPVRFQVRRDLSSSYIEREGAP